MVDRSAAAQPEIEVPSDSRLLALPREIRNRIYDYLHRAIFVNLAEITDKTIWLSMSIRIDNAPFLSVLLTHSMIYAEYLEAISLKYLTVSIFPHMCHRYRARASRPLVREHPAVEVCRQARHAHLALCLNDAFYMQVSCQEVIDLVLSEFPVSPLSICVAFRRNMCAAQYDPFHHSLRLCDGTYEMAKLFDGIISGNCPDRTITLNNSRAKTFLDVPLVQQGACVTLSKQEWGWYTLDDISFELYTTEEKNRPFWGHELVENWVATSYALPQPIWAVPIPQEKLEKYERLCRRPLMWNSQKVKISEESV